MKITQLSVFAENKPGHVIAPVRLLADHAIDLRALSLADTQRFGILRMIVSDAEKAAALLEEAGFLVKLTEVLALAVPDHPGGLSEILNLFEGTPVNIEYMYAFPYGLDGKKAALIFRFDDPDAALALLAKAGVKPLDREEL
jgi:hypothetical protein